MANSTSSTTATTTATTPFLDILPPELRTHIYTHLLVTPIPLKGLTARASAQYDIHTAILRTNKQIYSEARHVFFGRNTFCVTSVPPVLIDKTDDEQEDEETPLGSGAFEPPLQLKDLALVRHLHIDLLYSSPPTASISTHIGAQRYITNLSYILAHLSPSTIKSLKITADTTSPSHASSTDPTNPTPTTTETLDIRTFLMPFHFADLTPRFARAIAALGIENVHLRFDFSDMYFDFVVPRDVAGRGGLVGFAGQVLVKRGEIALKGIFEDLEGEEEGNEGEGDDEGAVGEEEGEEEGKCVVDWVC